MVSDYDRYEADQERGTVRWFGPPWEGWLCRPNNQVPTPVGEECGSPLCDRPISFNQRGLTIPYAFRRGMERPPGTYWQAPPGWWVTPYHLACFANDVLDLKA